jgi:hypothetical protein
LLKLPGDGSAPAPESIDRRLKPGKLKNWQKRYNEEELGVPLALVQQGEPQSEPTAVWCEAKLIECVGFVIEPDLFLDRDVIEVPGLPEPSLEHVGELSPGPDFENDGAGEAQINQEQEEILDWSALDVLALQSCHDYSQLWRSNVPSRYHLFPWMILPRTPRNQLASQT